MYEEGPYEFYLRAKDNFTKSGDVEDAAEVFLSLLNLSQHDIVVPTNPNVTEAMHLLKDAGVDTSGLARERMGYNDESPRRPGRLSESGKHVRAQLRRQELIERIRQGKLDAEKEAWTHRKQGVVGNTSRKLQSFYQGESDGNLRDYLEGIFSNIRVGDEEKDETVVNHIPDDLIDALYSARPESARKSSQRDETHEEMVPDHPMERIPLYRDNTFANVMRTMYREGGSIADMDREMREWEKIHVSHPHQKGFGKYGENSVGLGDLFQYGLDNWRNEIRERTGTDGSQNDFVEHLILRHEGIPEERIFDECYDGNGSWDKTRAERLLESPWDRKSPRLGIIPKLLGLEALPPEDAKQVLRWWVSGESHIDPGRNTANPERNSFLAGQLDSKGLLHRIWEQRKHAMVTAPLTRASSQNSQQFAPDYFGDLSEDAATQMAWMKAIMLNRSPQQTETIETDRGQGYIRNPEAGPTLFQLMANAEGILPDKNGAYGDKQPEFSKSLIQGWVDNKVRGFNKTRQDNLLKYYDTARKTIQQEIYVNDAMSAHRSSLMPDGSPSFTSVYHDNNLGGGMGLGPVDVATYWHDFLNGLFTEMGATTPDEREVVRDPDRTEQRKKERVAEIETLFAPSSTVPTSQAREEIDQLTIPLPIVGEATWASSDDRRGPSRTRKFDARPWFASDLPPDRAIVGDDFSTFGSIWSTNNGMNDVSHSRKLAGDAAAYQAWANSRRTEKARQETGRKTVTGSRRGDASHLPNVTKEQRKLRSLRLQQHSMKHGNTYGHKAENDYGDLTRDISLLDILFGLTNAHGKSHDLFDIARKGGIDGPNGLLTHLISEANKTPMMGEGAPSDNREKPIHLLTDAAGITDYVMTEEGRDGKKRKRIGAGPLDRAEGNFNIYIENELGTKDKNGKTIFHGLEPSGPDNGHRETVYTRLRDFTVPAHSLSTKQIHEWTPEDFLIEPHHPRFSISAPTGHIRDLRHYLENGYTSKKGRSLGGSMKGVRGAESGWHKSELERLIPDEKERRELLEEIPPEGGRHPDRVLRPVSSMKHYDRFPVVDPEGRAFASWMADNLRGIDNVFPITDTNKGDAQTYHRNFKKFVIRSPDFQRMFLDPRNRVDTDQEVEAGGTGNQAMSAYQRVSQEQAGLGGSGSGSEGGAIIAQHPVVLMRDHIARMQKWKDRYTEPDSIQASVLEDAINLQKQMMIDYAYSEEGELLTDHDSLQGSFQAQDGLGAISSQLRQALDGYEMTGTIAQALKKYYISQNPEWANKFGMDAEGYVNHMHLLQAAERMLHDPDQSWREKLASKMDELGADRVASNLRNRKTRAHWSTPEYSFDPPDEEAAGRVKGAMKAERVQGLDMVRHYLENHVDAESAGMTPAEFKKKMTKAKQALATLSKEYPTKKDFLNGIEDFVGANAEMNRPGRVQRNGHYPTSRGEANPDYDEGGAITGFQFGNHTLPKTEYNALIELCAGLHSDVQNSNSLVSTDNDELWSLPTGRKGKPALFKGGKSPSRNWNQYKAFANAMYGMYDYRKSEPGEGTRSIKNRDAIGSLTHGEDFDAPSLFNSTGVLSGAGTASTPTIDLPHASGKIPRIAHGGGKRRRMLHLPPNAVQHAFSDSSLNYSEQDLYPTATGFGELRSPSWDGTSTMRTASQTSMRDLSPEESLRDAGWADVRLSLDVLTDEDLLLKGKDGKPVPIKAMHRIFDLEDLSSLRGFSGDWIATAWPKGQRLMVEKKKKTVRAWDSQANTVSLPNSVKKGLKEAYDNDYLIDTIWDMDTLHIVDIIGSGDEKIHDEDAKDRVRLLRAKFEATEEVLIPAPINTKRSDSEGLQQCVKDLLKEKGVQRVLLRDAESTYMRGEARHPRWVLLSPKREIDVLVVSSKGDRHCIAVGPFPDGIAKKMGNRKEKYEDEWYMDVGSITEAKVEEGQYITVSFSSVTMQSRNKFELYKVNAPRYVGLSEASATDSVATLKILSGFKEENIPHGVNVQKGSIYLNFPTGQVIYETEPQGHAFMLKGVDAPDDYTLRLAQSQQEYWAPVATILLRAEKEEVVPEPPANHDAKPKKVIPEKNRIPKDPSEVKEDVSKSLSIAVEELNRLLKEKITWTGPRALGIDYATPVNSPSGPTENTEGYNLPDHDPGHRQEKGGDCWCGAMKGQTCEQGSGQKMEHCPDAKPPKDEEDEPKHLQISHNSQSDSSA